MAQSQGVTPLNSEKDIEDLKTNNKLSKLVFEVTAADGWEYYCNKMAVPFDKLAKEFEGKAKFYKLDLKNCQNFARANNLETYPSFVLMEDGKEVDVFQGATKLRELRKAITGKTAGLRG